MCRAFRTCAREVDEGPHFLRVGYVVQVHRLVVRIRDRYEARQRGVPGEVLVDGGGVQRPGIIGEMDEVKDGPACGSIPFSTRCAITRDSGRCWSVSGGRRSSTLGRRWSVEQRRSRIALRLPGVRTFSIA